ncbi:pyrroline-5-carboxylate reductase [Spiroplasma endosymbiont of Panorpa germanica]|uniref:pyrroline-5-carboxylate reductase n=1 Tax=Spiroplasma endosymbiont of Panorpa germanica TaxID=3066314 RepID=UPI0030CCF394
MSIKNIGFIGTGNMGMAIIKGIKHNKKLGDFKLFTFNRNLKTSESFLKNNLTTPLNSIKELVEKTDVIFLGIKPKDMLNVLGQISPFVDSSKIIISMVVSWSIEKINSFLLKEGSKKIIRIMPNINANVNKSATAWCSSWELSPIELINIEMLLKAFGAIYKIEESDFSKFAALAGSSPALILYFYELFENLAAEMELGYLNVKELFLSVFEGTFKNYLNSDLKPNEIIKQVTSPGGTTMEGIAVFDNSDFKLIVKEAIKAILKKDEKLSSILT